MHRYNQLEIWQRSKSFCIHIYRLTEQFPKNDEFGIANQMKRAAVSIPSNIAEGTSRSSNKEFSRFLQIALGSAFELDTQLSICYELEKLNHEELIPLQQELNSIIQMIARFKSKINL